VKPLPMEMNITLYQALSPLQLAALIRADWRHIEPGRGGELFTCLKLHQCYAEMVARQWQLPSHGAGYVVRILLPATALKRFQPETVAYEEHVEYRLPVSELGALSKRLLQPLELVSAFVTQQHSYSIPAGSEPLRSLVG
jgi:hypothetical protein